MVIVVVAMMPVVVMMTLTYSRNHLCLRRKRCREAENEGQCEQNLLHSPSMGACTVLRSSDLTNRTAYATFAYIIFTYSSLQHATPTFLLRMRNPI